MPMLTEIATEESYRHMLALTDSLQQLLTKYLDHHHMACSITRLSPRLELQFSASRPRNAQEAREAKNDMIESTIHLYLLNRGVLLTPFHDVMLICPATSREDVERLVKVFDECVGVLIAQ